MGTATDPTSRLTGPSLVDQTTDRLRQAIFQGAYQPGSHLREMRIAKELGVSQSTVREALQRLESAGLVTRTPNVGTSVTRLSPREVRERVALRVLLEVKAAQEASGRMGDAEFRELEARLAAMAEPIRRDVYYEAAQADLKFHRYIWECAGR
ncbi:MAG: GntR family transcriptional regulator [Bryobacterales bacterium]|nr:GntR family transcriptional regulator [Bryobacterales bacterium]